MERAEIEQALKEGRLKFGTWCVVRWGKPNPEVARFINASTSFYEFLNVSRQQTGSVFADEVLSIHETQAAAEHAAKCFCLVGRWGYVKNWQVHQWVAYDPIKDIFTCSCELGNSASLEDVEKQGTHATRAEAEAALRSSKFSEVRFDEITSEIKGFKACPAQVKAWLKKSNNQTAIEQLREWLSRPDDLGDDWWDEFERALKNHRNALGEDTDSSRLLRESAVAETANREGRKAERKRILSLLIEPLQELLAFVNYPPLTKSLTHTHTPTEDNFLREHAEIRVRCILNDLRRRIKEEK